MNAIDDPVRRRPFFPIGEVDPDAARAVCLDCAADIATHETLRSSCADPIFDELLTLSLAWTMAQSAVALIAAFGGDDRPPDRADASLAVVQLAGEVEWAMIGIGGPERCLAFLDWAEEQSADYQAPPIADLISDEYPEVYAQHRGC
jgi:hypothetical protein